MQWPQIAVLALQALGVMHTFAKGVRDPSDSSGAVTLRVFLYMVVCAAYDGVLHAGGFWS